MLTMAGIQNYSECMHVDVLTCELHINYLKPAHKLFKALISLVDFKGNYSYYGLNPRAY